MRAGRRNLQRAAPAYANAGKRRESYVVGRWPLDLFFLLRSGDYSGDYEVWRMPADGGVAPERMTWNGGYMARESADGKWLYYSKHVYPTTGFWRIALPARALGSRKRWSRRTYRTGLRPPGRWARGSCSTTRCRRSRGTVSASASRQFGNRTHRDLPVGNIRLARGLSLSPDGRWLVRSQIDRALTLVMIAE